MPPATAYVMCCSAFGCALAGAVDSTEPLTFNFGLNLGTTTGTLNARLTLPGLAAFERRVPADGRPSIAFGQSRFLV